MQVVSVINYKGGVGKTTLTANLGAYAAMKGYRVLMIDLDPQTQLTFQFVTPSDWEKVCEPRRTLRNFFEPVIKGSFYPRTLKEVIVRVHAGRYGVDLISSHLDLIDTDMELAAMIPAPTIPMLASNSLRVYSLLRKALYEVKDEYDLVLMDCPPNFYAIVKNALLCSNYYLVPTRLDYMSMLGIDNLQRSITRHIDQYNEYMKIVNDEQYKPVFLEMLGIVPMMVNYLKQDDLIAANEKYLRELEDKKYYIFHKLRNSSSVFAPKPISGVPLVLTKPRFYQGMNQKIVKELKDICSEFLLKLKLVKED